MDERFINRVLVVLLITAICMLVACAKLPTQSEPTEEVVETVSILEKSQLKTPPVVIQEYPRITSDDLKELQLQGEPTLDEGNIEEEQPEEPIVSESENEGEGAAVLLEEEPLEEIEVATAEDYEEVGDESLQEEEQLEEIIEEDVVMVDEEEESAGMIYLGEYQITAYEWTGNPCANGNYPEEGYTVACNSLPFGTVVYIEGIGYRTVEDRGAEWHSDQWIDIYMGDVWTCNQFGVQYLNVWVVE